MRAHLASDRFIFHLWFFGNSEETMPKPEPRATPEGDLAHLENLKVQQAFRAAARAQGWNVVQQQMTKKWTDTGSRQFTIYKFIGPMTLYIDCWILMDKGSQKGAIYVCNNAPTQRGDVRGPLLTFGTYTIPPSPDRLKYDLDGRDALAVSQVFDKGFSGDYFRQEFTSIGVPPDLGDRAVDWFVRRQQDWVGHATSLLSHLKEQTYVVVVEYLRNGAFEVIDRREGFQTEAEAADVKARILDRSIRVQVMKAPKT
jgi:hypothetical protein